DARQAIQDLQGLERGSLTIGASTTPGIYVLPRLLGAFRQRHPGIQLTLQLGNSEGIERRVRASELDLGLVGGHRGCPGEACLSAGLPDEARTLSASARAFRELLDTASAAGPRARASKMPRRPAPG